jgi:hypothetical protein
MQLILKPIESSQEKFIGTFELKKCLDLTLIYRYYKEKVLKTMINGKRAYTSK